MKEKVYVMGKRELTAEDVIFDDDFEFAKDENGYSVLNFYLAAWFKPEEVFAELENLEADDCWVNLYANYIVDRHCVSDDLEIVINLADSSSIRRHYRLSEQEKELLLAAMDAYCQKRAGHTLNKFLTSTCYL